MRARLAVACATALVAQPLLAGCADVDDAGPEPSLFARGGATGVDVDTPELRAQRDAAGISPCPGSVDTAAGTPVDGGLPELSLPCLGGGPDVDLAALRGPLVVNLWAQWCEPCADELPYLARLHEAGVDVLGVDFQDTQPGAALALAERAGATYPSVADVDGALRAPLRVAGMPTTLFVDGDGRVTAVLAQEFRSYGHLVEAVDEHLGVRP